MPWPIQSLDVFDLFRQGVRVPLENVPSGPIAPGLGLEILHADDQKAYGTAGGASVIGIQVRTLNTLRVNTIVGASLAVNQITLPIGTFRIFAQAPCGGSAGKHQIAFWNVTDAALAAIGSSFDSTTDPGYSMLFGRFTIVAPKVFELRHYVQFVLAGSGLGLPCSATFPGGGEIYSRCFITKE